MRVRDQTAIDEAQKHTTSKYVALLGYCFGGTGVFEAALANLNVTVRETR
jgi:dienelactone hydrolase